MSDSFLKLCSLAKIEIDNIINSINLDHKTGSDFLSEKNAASPVVTKIDLEIEKQLRKLIECQYPNAGILGEEYAEKMGIMGALSLYLYFLNMFMFLLQFMGNRD